MARPRVLGVECARLARPVRDEWARLATEGTPGQRKDAQAKLKGLRTLEARIVANPLAAGDSLERRLWPACVRTDYGDMPNLTRFELAGYWRGLYVLAGEADGVRAWILYLWDHPTYDRHMGFRKR